MKKIRIDEQSANEFKKIKRIIGIVINSLEKRIGGTNGGEICDNRGELPDLSPEDREDVVSTVCKLGNLLVRLACLEVDDDGSYEDIEEIDIDVMKDYIETLINNRDESKRDSGKQATTLAQTQQQNGLI
ncbi:MAG: hypothetical protein LBB13_03185 [Rickettsiales bacterium]|jgi:hypothetical protein|nr:hypothetical protein [Rickettsiales bacterium]